MRAAWSFAYNIIDRAIPNGLSLYTLGAGLLAAAFTQAAAATDAYYGYRLEMWLALLAMNLANIALAAIVAANALRRSSALARRLRGDRPPIFAFRFIHIAVAVYAAVALSSLLPALRAMLNNDDGMFVVILLLLTSASMSGAALVPALLGRLRWRGRLAALGAVVSIAVFGCAVGFAPTIYGRDLQPPGWYAILTAAIPALAFMALYLRRAPIFSFRQSRWRRRGLAMALFAALGCALALYMALNPFEKFSANLRAAVDGGASEIRFADLTDFDWDTVEIYTPYTFVYNLSPEARERADMVSLSYLGYGFNRRADFMAFLKDGEIACYEVVWRDNHRFDYPHPDEPYPWTLRREDAVFAVYLKPGDKRHTLALAD